MRVPPRVNIEFLNDNYQIEVISVDTVKLKFKVFDTKSNSYLKDAENKINIVRFWNILINKAREIGQ